MKEAMEVEESNSRISFTGKNLENEFASNLGSNGKNLEDEFASKVTLSPVNNSEDNLAPFIHPYDVFRSEVGEEFWEQFEDEPFEGGEVDLLEHYIHRTVVEDGLWVEKPADKWNITLKDGPPEGRTAKEYHLDILKQVVGSDASEVYRGYGCDNLFGAILTHEEGDKIRGLTQVEAVSL